MEIRLGPCESKLIVFDNEEKGHAFVDPDFDNPDPVTINGPWKVALKNIDGKSRSIILDNLIDFSKREDLKIFGGTIIYESVFKVSEGSNIKYLQLGETYGVSEIEINDQKAAIQWYGNPVHDISKLVKKGNNTIRIKLVTTLGNYMKSLSDNKVAQSWTQNQPIYSVGLVGPVRIL